MQAEMRESSRYIIMAGAFVSGLSSLYFLSLVFHVPFLVTVALILASLFLLNRWIVMGTSISQPGAVPEKGSWLPLFILIVAMGSLSLNCYSAAMKYGQWDASAIWNFHAQYLTDPLNWKKLFQNVAYGHPDYPLCLPATIAFFMRVLSSDSTIMVPYVFSVAVTLSIPVLIYQEVARKSLLVAAFTLVLFILERYYVMSGVSQYADILVAFFFLCAFVCAGYMLKDTKYVALCAFFLASCAWTKNEGAILAVVFVAFYGRVFFAKKNIGYTALGLLLPLLSLAILKLICGAPNDLLHATGSGTLGLLFRGERYAVIFSSYKDAVYTKYACTTIVLLVYAVLCAVKKMAPGRDLLILITCLIAYSMIYVITPKDLKWHLETSQSRLLLQLMPALVYVVASGIAGLEIALPAKVRLQK